MNHCCIVLSFSAFDVFTCILCILWTMQQWKTNVHYCCINGQYIFLNLESWKLVKSALSALFTVWLQVLKAVFIVVVFSPLGGSRARFKHHIDISSFLCDISRGEYVSKFIYFLFNLLIYIFSNTGAGYTHQSDIGQKHRNIQSFTLTFTPNRDLEWGAGLAFI